MTQKWDEASLEDLHAIMTRLTDLFNRLGPPPGWVPSEEPEETPEEFDEPGPKVCEMFVWLGQSWTSCDECGRPAWEHEGYSWDGSESVEELGTGKRVLYRWTGLMADAHHYWKHGGTVELVRGAQGQMLLKMGDISTGADLLG